MSRNGYSVLDDSHTMALGEDGMVEPRQGNRADFYFFGYGHRYVECLQDFYRLCGKTPLLPRYTFGNWWSRYHKYTETEYKELVERFEKEEVPFSVAVVDGKAYPIIEIAPKQGFYDYKNKYQAGSTVETCPAEISPELTEKMQHYAEAGAKALCIEGYARFDFMMKENGDMYCLEANTLPGMTPTSLIPQEAKVLGIDYPDLCEELIRISLKKYSK